MRARIGRSIGALCLVLPVQVFATEPDGSSLSRAHDAYTRGAAAYAQGDYTRAARELAAADALVPDPVTLRAALEAVTLADDPILGAELLARAARAPDDAALAHAAAVARERFAHRTGAIVVRCDGCLALVDNVPVTVGTAHVVLPGVHLVAVQRNGPPVPRLVTVGADETREVIAHDAGSAFDRSAKDSTVASPPRDDSGGVSPLWFGGAAAVVVGLGAVTVASAVNTVSDHSSFENARCGVTNGPSCATIASAGQSAQTRTAWLGVATGVAIAGTTALGLFGVRWHAPGASVATLSVHGSSASLRFTF
jgi:hypothetical protein